MTERTSRTAASKRRELLWTPTGLRCSPSMQLFFSSPETSSLIGCLIRELRCLRNTMIVRPAAPCVNRACGTRVG